ncbi:MAG TPA: hypothetical protein VD886_15885 [Herpetosiphonaceae bacterium]|nr:hypothetical protein [Herpetosiphonaceae bacterium]
MRRIITRTVTTITTVTTTITWNDEIPLPGEPAEHSADEARGDSPAGSAPAEDDPAAE